MLRQTSGSVLCVSCGQLVGVNDERCMNCGRWNPALWGYAGAIRKLGRDFGFVKLVIVGCIILYVINYYFTAVFPDPRPMPQGPFSFLSPGYRSSFLFGASGFIPVFGFGRWWTLLSAGWLHGGLLHIAFNMMWVRNLAPVTAEIYGAGRMVIIYTISCIAGFGLSSVAGYLPLPGLLRGAGMTVGASAPIFGLLGALVYSGKRGASSMVGRQAWSFAVILFIFGLVFPGVDNYAHAGGFIGGYGIAKWLDPMKPERGDHLVVALVCLVLAALSIIASVIDGIPLMRVLDQLLSR
jgi:rhomboid protease GluP